MIDNNERIKRNAELRRLRDGGKSLEMGFMAANFDADLEIQIKRGLRSMIKFLNELDDEDKITFSDEIENLRKALL